MFDAQIISEIVALKDDDLAIHHLSFFKTGVGQYGYGDLFLGVKVPVLRAIAKKHYKAIALSEIEKLLKNKYHEIRAVALFIMTLKYKKSDKSMKNQIFQMYVDNIEYINNWDLVDVSAAHIVGEHVFPETDILYKLSDSNHLWSERVAVIATHYNIKRKDFGPTIHLCKKFLSHKHDLIHKACGWMLREIGKIDEKVLFDFLDENAKLMPRVALRYSLEKYDKNIRLKYY